MKTIELYRFVKDHNVEYHWHDDDVILMPNIRDIGEFYKLFGAESFDDGGIECRMKDGYFCFWMKSICENNDIELKEIFDTK